MEEKTLDAMLNEEAIKPDAEAVNAKRPWVEWTVGGNTYKLKLTASMVKMLERSFKQSLPMAVIGEEGVPPINVVLEVIQGAMQKYQHGMNGAKIEALYDAYIDEGHTLYDALADVVYPLLVDMGFFTKTTGEEITAGLKATMAM